MDSVFLMDVQLDGYICPLVKKSVPLLTIKFTYVAAYQIHRAHQLKLAKLVMLPK